MASEQPRIDKVFSIGKVSNVVLGLYLTTSVGVCGMLYTSIQNLQLQLATIQANRFTVKDGIELRERLAESEKALSRLPDAFPPTWFMSDYKTVKESLVELSRRITLMDKEVTQCQRQK